MSSTRRDFLACAGLLAARWALPAPLWSLGRFGRRIGPHPTPRPGITSAKVMTAEQLARSPAVIELFDQIRQIPQIVDGIRCHCGCADLEGYYSLLTCFETPAAMARHCLICQGQARLVFQLHQSGQTLDQIRDAIDARFG